MDKTMTEILNMITDALINSVDWIAVLIVIFGGLIAKYRFCDWKWNNALKTLIVSTAAISLYVLILMYSGNYNKSDAPKFFFGYLTATALYPLIVKPLENLIKKTANYWSNKR